MVFEKQEKMNSREKILSSISKNKPDFIPAPDVLLSATTYEDIPFTFQQTLLGIGGQCISAADYNFISRHIESGIENNTIVINEVERIKINSVPFTDLPTPQDQEKIYLTIVEGKLGVAENAAIWVEPLHANQRVLPFICQHLVIVLNKKDLVSNMHEAYEMLNLKELQFGVFIAGPSKTADIEQSLVIGAHGARSLRVYMLD